MEIQKTQANYRGIGERAFDAFIAEFNATYEPRQVKPAGGDSYVRVYHYGEGRQKFNICYDRKAESVQVTAGDTMLEVIEMYIDRYARTAPTKVPVKPPRSVSDSAAQPRGRAVPPKETPRTALKETPAALQKPASQQDKASKQTETKGSCKTVKKAKRAEKEQTERSAAVEESKASAAESAYKDGYSLSKYEFARLERSVEELRGDNAVASVTGGESNVGTAQHVTKYTVAGKDKSRVIVQYAHKRKVVQIQGKPCALADLVQTVLSEGATERDIVQARVEYNKTRAHAKGEQADSDATNATAIRKQLTKSLPHGVKYLSKQSQTYLYYALVDLSSNLSNYGGILATAYQGLENLISNLQHSEGINVKMIGQAYEKQDGVYTLKASYRRRIKSVIYNEVLSALYTEYFEKRHYYTHSDNFNDTARIVQSQQTAQAEFKRLVSVIEYNCTKLSEIGFTVETAAAEQRGSKRKTASSRA